MLREYVTYTSLSLAMLTLGSDRCFSMKQVIQETHPKIIHVTVFIHGTILPLVSPKAIKQAIVTTVKERQPLRAFEYYWQALRSESMYGKQLISKEHGLQEVRFLRNHWVNWILTQAYKYMIERVSDHHRTDLFYTFGWQGLLSADDRLNAAKHLYDALVKERTKLMQEHPDRHISFSLVTHSHGCNVALLLPLIEGNKQKNMVIEELISFGAPVQRETRHAIESPMFKRCYHFYSKGDFIQVVDFFSTQGMSERTFPAHPEKLVQTELDINGIKPGHASLYFYGSRLHESRLAIDPFPPLIFAPWIIAWLNQQKPSSDINHLSIRKHGNWVTLASNGNPTHHPAIDWHDLVSHLDIDGYLGNQT